PHTDEREHTHDERPETSLALRESYGAAGYGHGHRVALLLENRPEFFFHFLALNALGASIVPVNPDYRHDELLYLLEHSEADLAVVTRARVADLELVARERAKPFAGCPAETMPPRLPTAGSAARGNPSGLESETSLLYTSGTTGRPKGCVLTNFYYLNAGAWYRNLGGRLQIDYGGGRFPHPLPLLSITLHAVS